MDLTRIKEIKELLKQYGARPEKYLGQHFILSKRALRQAVEAAKIKKTDVIVEIGPGLGTLTRELAQTGAEIIAVEKDPLMIKILKETAGEYKNVKIIHADARHLLTSDVNKFGDKGVDKHGYKIVANLPYNIASFLIRSWLEAENLPAGRQVRPELMVLMIQKEVARRICAGPPHSNLLAMSVQFYAEPEIIAYVKKSSFWPEPKVASAIIKIVPLKKRADLELKESFFKVLKAGFAQPRKQLAGNLSKQLKIKREIIEKNLFKLGLNPKARAENLGVEEWLNLTRTFKS